MKKINFKLSNFHCESCVKLSSRRISKINNISDLIISIDGSGSFFINRDLNKEELESVLEGTDYKVLSFNN